MARPGTSARAFWEHVEANQGDIRRLFNEAVEIANRASLCVGDEDDAQAWRDIGILLTDLKEGLDDRRAKFIAAPPAARARRNEVVGSLGEPDDRFAGVSDFGVFGRYGGANIDEYGMSEAQSRRSMGFPINPENVKRHKARHG